MQLQVRLMEKKFKDKEKKVRQLEEEILDRDEKKENEKQQDKEHLETTKKLFEHQINQIK